MGLIDYMILNDLFQGVRRDCVRPNLVDAAILIKSLAPIALFYLFDIKLLLGLRYPILFATFAIFYFMREDKVLSAIYGEPSARRPGRPIRR